jgi:hypothetical protein
VVEVPDFTAAYNNRLRIIGRRLLVSEKKEGARVIRLYDPQTGTNVWERTFRASAIIMQTEEPHLLGVIDPAADGKLLVFDVETQKDVLVADLDPKDLEKVDRVHLLADSSLIYVVCNRAAEQRGAVVGGNVFPNVMHGLRCLPVNGMLYAFDRAGGKLRWKKEVPNQMLVLEQYKATPILLFTAYQQRVAGGGFNRGAGAPIANTRSIEKRTGKLIYDSDSGSGHNQFFALTTNLQAGTVELIGNQFKIVHFIEGVEGSQVSATAPSRAAPPALPARRIPVPRDW